MATPINVILDGESIIDYVDSVKISMGEGDFCYTVDVSLSSLEKWESIDPKYNADELRVKVLIGDEVYESFIEKRDTDLTTKGVQYSIWGRSKQAYMASPFSVVLNDDTTSGHIWQTQTCTVSEIIAYLQENVIPVLIDIQWNVEDFVVRLGTFSVTGSDPIGILSTLAADVGAIFRPTLEGGLEVVPYLSGAENPTVVRDYNDYIALTNFKETFDPASGYNAVTVYGGTQSSSVYLSVDNESQVTDSNGQTTQLIVYHRHPDPTVPVMFAQCPGDAYSVEQLDSGIITIEEEVTLIWGAGTRKTPDSNGSTDVAGDSSIPIQKMKVSTDISYLRLKLMCSEYTEENEQNSLLLYFADKSAHHVFNWNYPASSSEQADLCKAVDIEWEENYPAVGASYFRVYDPMGLYNAASGTTTQGTSPSRMGDAVSEYLEEFVVFKDGKGSLKRPLSLLDTVQFPYGREGDVSSTFGMKNLTLSHTDLTVALVRYYTAYTRWMVVISIVSDQEKFELILASDVCPLDLTGTAKATTKTTTTTTKDDETTTDTTTTEIEIASKDGTESIVAALTAEATADGSSNYSLVNNDTERFVVVLVKDKDTGAPVAGATVNIGGFTVRTGSDGKANVGTLKTGTYSINATAEGYVDTQQDGMNNEKVSIS